MVGVLFGVIVNVRRHAKSRAQLWQAFAVLLMVLCIVVYFGIAVIALVEAVITILQGESSEPVRNGRSGSCSSEQSSAVSCRACARR